MDDKSELSRIRYEFQHFGYPAEAAILGVKDLVYGEIKSAVESMEVAIVSKNKYQAEEKKIKAVSPLLIDAFISASNQPLEMLEEQIKDCFSIPNHILLPGDEIQRQQFTKEEEISLNNKLENLKSRFKRAICMEKMLLAEKKVSEELSRKEFEIMKLLKSEKNESTVANLMDRTPIDRITNLMNLLNCEQTNKMDCK